MPPMAPLTGRNRTIGLLLLLVLVAAGMRFVPSLAQKLAEEPFKEDYERFRSVRLGISEPAVRAQLGEPAWVHPSGTPPSRYCVSGWACEKRPVTGKLLIYVAGEPIAYIYFDQSGRVEYVYVGGS